MPSQSNGVKRKASPTPSAGDKAAASTASSTGKKAKTEKNGKFDHSRKEEEYGIVDRRFYPPQMSSERCKMYKSGELERPIETLQKAQKDTKAARDKIPVKDAVVHWFKTDLRIADNKGLDFASQKAASKKVPLVCVYIISPQDYEAHVVGVARVEFILRTLKVLQEDLADRDIPLYVETVDKRRHVPQRLIDLCKEWGASHLYTNAEYEVDELRREAQLTRLAIDNNIAVEVVADTCVVTPGELKSGSGNQYAVFTPWFRAWLTYLKTHPHNLTLANEPASNPPGTRTKQPFKKLFECAIPDEGPPNKRFKTAEEKKRFASLWPAGEHEARTRLDKFAKERIRDYKAKRNYPAANGTSIISVHLAAGTLSARTAVVTAQNANSTKNLDGGSEGIATWISEVSWREYYKTVVAFWPYINMYVPFKPEYLDIEWEYDMDLFQRWKDGKTGYPYIDAAMRQMVNMGYMHNRARMGVASFLAKDLLLDWRMGERFFAENLIDHDVSSNLGGWGFSSSTGVDPQPYFRIFNPITQGETYDADGEYIRKWVPELKDIKGKAIHNPYADAHARKIAEKNGYPKMCIDHKEARNRALARYKAGLGRDTA